MRHKLDNATVKKSEPAPLPQIIVRNNLSEWQVWMYFLSTHKPVIKIHSDELLKICNMWLKDWIHGRKIPSLPEQKKILFSFIPTLEKVWNDSNWALSIPS